MDYSILPWLFSLFVTIHNIEEAIWLPDWSKKSGIWHPVFGDGAFRFAVGFISILAFVLAYFSMTGGKGSLGTYLISLYALIMLINVLLPHLLATIFMKTYAPGTATAILLNFPISSLLLYVGFKEGYIEYDIFKLFVFAGIGIFISAIGILFFIRHIKKR